MKLGTLFKLIPNYNLAGENEGKRFQIQEEFE